MRELTNLFAAIAKVKAEGCDNCKGKGSFRDWNDRLMICPTCAKLREIAEWEWHECVKVTESHIHPIEGCMVYWAHCCCGKYAVNWFPHKLDALNCTNPTFTVQSIRAALEAVGEWKGFTRWLVFHKRGAQPYSCGSHDNFADILTSDPLTVEAAKAYLTQRLEELR